MPDLVRVSARPGGELVCDVGDNIRMEAETR
jgi:hypothetical protein